MASKSETNGNVLVARAAADSGCGFFGGYPITPSSEIMHTLSDLLPKNGAVCMQMEDEIAGICAALGAAMSGKRAMTASSGPGLSLKSENIGLAHISEVPIVIANVMRGGPSTGLPTRVQQGDILQTKSPSHGDLKTIALCPGSLEECYTETIRAFNLADRFMQPVYLLLDETIGHMDGVVNLPDIEEVKKGIKGRKVFNGDKNSYEPYGVKQDEAAVLNPMFQGYRYHFTGLHHGPKGHPTEDAVVCDNLIKRLFNKVEAHEDEYTKYEEYKCDDADILLIAYGSVTFAAKEAILALREQGIKVGLFRPITIWPSPEKKLKEITAKFDKIVSIELNMGQYIQEIERVSKKDNIAKLCKANGRPISPHEIIDTVKGL